MAGVEAKAAKIATKVATQSQQGQVGKMPQQGPSAFDQVLQKHQQGVSNIDSNMMEVMNAYGLDNNAHPADNAISASDLNVNNMEIAGKVDSVQSPNQVTNMLSEMNRDGLQMDKIMELVTSSNKFSNRDLLLMQAALHKVTLNTEFYVKIAEAGKSSVQQLVQRTQAG